MVQLSQTLNRLNIATRAFQGAADEPWLHLVAPGRVVRLDEYRELLESEYGFDAPLEAALAYTRGMRNYLNVNDRFRCGFMAQDLFALGLGPGDIARLPHFMIGPFSTAGEGFGWFYVHERCAFVLEPIIGELAYRHPELASATSFARSVDIGVAWDDFGLALERVALTPEIEGCIATAAIEALRSMTEWIVRAPVRRNRRGPS